MPEYSDRHTKPAIRGQADVDIADVLFLHRISNPRGTQKKKRKGHLRYVKPENLGV